MKNTALTQNSQPGVSIAGIKVRQDGEGRFCLNDLHKASGGMAKHRPTFWMMNDQTASLIDELKDDVGNPTSIVRGRGKAQGTYVCKELVYAYAMWISARFHLDVIRAYDALVTGQVEMAEGRSARAAARLEAPFMTDAVKHQRSAQGKAVSHYHFSNEFDLINRIALGMSAKQYRAEHGMAANDPVRDSLTPCEIKCIEHLQRVNASLIDIGMAYEERKARLNQIYIQRHASKLFAEVQRLEA
ncbi:KilA-N domain-containing protein [Halomonas sp. IOP_31]|uniref:KilA-N domain-containing protein n=1 Tax=Halomonas sp. IOP_31 TaxID=2876584 RepID=UPI001E51C405|nr:KilA-N domain-containing protein [Halomonas sp. IOP_31]MCD6006876.1 KilA-N domain-containing protein [Halomonas sp. IOP_31]